MSFSDRSGAGERSPTELNPPLTFVRNTGWEVSLLSSQETHDGQGHSLRLCVTSVLCITKNRMSRA